MDALGARAASDPPSPDHELVVRTNVRRKSAYHLYNCFLVMVSCFYKQHFPIILIFSRSKKHFSFYKTNVCAIRLKSFSILTISFPLLTPTVKLSRSRYGYIKIVQIQTLANYIRIMNQLIMLLVEKGTIYKNNPEK